MRQVAEVLIDGTIPIWKNAEWVERFPWVEQGTTAAGPASEPCNFGFFGTAPVGEITDRWKRLREATGMKVSIHARQVHGARVATWLDSPAEGMLLVEGYDAHATSRPGVLLGVSVADCIPISFVSETGSAVGLAHAGWRGLAAGVLEATVEALGRLGATPSSLWVHCGPSICGRCYEVGPEVHGALTPGQVPGKPAPIDLAAVVAARARAVGVGADRVTGSEQCTRCGPGAFFSHRGGSSGRQIGILAIRG